MPLRLRYRINEGINITEDRRSIDVIVRDLTFDSINPRVSLELHEDGIIHNVELLLGKAYSVTPNCTLYIPKNKERRIRTSVFIQIDATSEVEFGEKREYPL